MGDTLRGVADQERFKYPDTDAGRARVLADYTAIIVEAKEMAQDLFSAQPQANVVVERAPPHKEKGGPFAYYNGPPMDGSRPGVFYANLGNPRDTFSFGMRTLACHEAIPGHHTQIALAREMKGVPLFRTLVPFTAYSEGWALYAERVADEVGFYKDSFDRLGYLMAQLFRASRLVVDTGIHHYGWSREEAVAFLADNTVLAENNIDNEVDRYITWPGQALAYKLGQLEMLTLRLEAQEALGDDFDLKAFHALVLEAGPMPLPVLRRRVTEWISPQCPPPIVPFLRMQPGVGDGQ